jgi:hypothetical protein
VTLRGVQEGPEVGVQVPWRGKQDFYMIIINKP